MMSPDGRKLMHGEIVLDGHKMFVSDEFSKKEGGTCKMPQTLGGTCVRITLHTDDADTVVERAVARGARILMEVQDMFWGARYGKLVDPYGHEWGLNQQLKQQTDERRKRQPVSSSQEARNNRPYGKYLMCTHALRSQIATLTWQ